MRKILLAALWTSLFALAGGDLDEVAPEVPAESSEWSQELSLYGWLPSFGGTLTYDLPGNPDSPSDPDAEGKSSVLDNIDVVFMGSYELRKAKWSFLIDGIYLGMSDEQSVTVDLPLNKTLTVGSEQDLSAWLVSGYAGYNIMESSAGRLDVIAGVRYFALDLDIDLFLNNRDKTFSPSSEFTDALVGIKGYINLSENWYVPYLFDIGAGDADLTYQAEVSVGYRFNWGNLLATYRYIHYEADNGSLLKDFDMYGPKIGVSFNF